MKNFKEILIAFLILVILGGSVVWMRQYSELKKQLSERTGLPSQNNILVKDSPFSQTPTTSTESTYDPVAIGEKLLQDYKNTAYGIQFIGLTNDWSSKKSISGMLTDKYRILFVSTKNDHYCAGLDAQCYVLLAGWGQNHEQPAILGQLNWGDEPLFSTVKFVEPDKIIFQTTNWWPGGEGDPPSEAEIITNWSVDLKTKQMKKGDSFQRPVDLNKIFQNVVN